MPYVNAKEMLAAAKRGHYAVGHFNLNNMESVRAFLLAAEEMKGEALSEFVRDLDATLSSRMEQEDHDLKNFTLIFDYRNAGKTLDGTKGALERTVNTLRGACLEEPK